MEDKGDRIFRGKNAEELACDFFIFSLSLPQRPKACLPEIVEAAYAHIRLRTYDFAVSFASIQKNLLC